MSDLHEPKETAQSPASAQPEEENVVSVWHGSGNTRFFRRRYFDGFTFYETLDAGGKPVTHKVYVGTWYTQVLPKSRRIRNRVFYALALLAGAALLFIGCTRLIYVNTRIFSTAPAFAGLLAFGWMLLALFNECTVPQRRTIGEYRASSLSLQRSGLMAAICGILTCLITLGFGFAGWEKPGLHVLAAACELAAAALGWLVRRVEAQVEFTQERSKDAGKYRM